MVVPSFLSWPESPITYDQRDHPSHIARPGCYPLIIDPIVYKKRLTRVLMDDGSGLNILYIDTLDAMRIPRSELRPAGSPFHGVLTFEVVDFLGSYHAILGWPCYTRFMAIPNYTYLKLKMPGPNGVITVSSAFSHALTCDHEHYELATVVANSSKLPWLGESSVPAAPDYNQPTFSSAFHSLEETKVVEIDPTNPTKTVRVRT
ncbi:uncharacterized protein [Miscanthus floridulus]|uniref:uncharacterized protein n=1 Tax=Miscanthus floridulus TaxID=154761 RepID=UPI003458945E